MPPTHSTRASRARPLLLALAALAALAALSVPASAQSEKAQGEKVQELADARADLAALQRGPGAGEARAFGELVMRIARRGAAAASAVPALVALLDDSEHGRVSAQALAWISRSTQEKEILEAAYRKLAALPAEKIQAHAAWWLLARLRQRAAPLLPRFEKRLLADVRGAGVFFELVRMTEEAGAPTLVRLLDHPRHGRNALTRLAMLRGGDLRVAHRGLFAALSKPALAGEARARLASLHARRAPRDRQTWLEGARAQLLAADPRVRSLCAEIVAELRDRSPETRNALFAQLATEDEETWLAAARALAATCPAMTLAARASQQRLDGIVRARAAVALGYIRPPALDALRVLLDDDIEGVRRSSATALYRIGAPALPTLTAALGTASSARAKRASLFALGRMGGAAAAALPGVRALCESTDKATARAARACAARIDAKEAR